MKRYLSIALMTTMLPLGAAAQEEMPAQEETLVEETEAPVAVVEEKVVVEKARPFLDKVDWQLMASGFYNFNAHRVAGDYASYPYTRYHGFGLNFAGADASYMDDTWGITLNIRYGTASGDLSPLAPLKQGFITWLPCDKFTLDIGFFDTIYGAEVADEWQNVNFSRGALYFNRQPFNHMGIRAGYAVNDKVGLTFMLTNGGVYGGTPKDFDEVPATGWQVSLSPAEDFALVIGGNHAPNGLDGNKHWDHLIDIVSTYNTGDLALIFNADFRISPNGVPVVISTTPTVIGESGDLSVVYGFSLAGLYSINEHWSAGTRLELLGGNNESGEDDPLVTATLTARYSPVEYLVFSLEPRIEYQKDAFTTRDGAGDSDIYFGLILGATAKIGN